MSKIVLPREIEFRYLHASGLFDQNYSLGQICTAISNAAKDPRISGLYVKVCRSFIESFYLTHAKQVLGMISRHLTSWCRLLRWVLGGQKSRWSVSSTCYSRALLMPAFFWATSISLCMNVFLDPAGAQALHKLLQTEWEVCNQLYVHRR